MVKISALPPMSSGDTDDELPVVDDSAATTKKVTFTVLKEWLQSVASWITTAMIGDGEVTGPKLDVDAIEHGYLLLKESELASPASTISITSIPAKNHLLIVIIGLSSSNIDPGIRFNNDSGNNYTTRMLANGSLSSATSQNRLTFEASGAAFNFYSHLKVQNRLADEKFSLAESGNSTSAGAAGAPNIRTSLTKWANTSAQINRVDLITATNNFAAGTKLLIFGKD